MKTLTKLISLVLAAVMMLSAMAMFVAAEEEPLFSDVKTTDWAYDGIKFATEKGLMNGTGGGKFSPQGKLTRGMVITVLYRLEGSPAVKFDEADFLDVPAGMYYSNAASWAVKNEVVTGTSTDIWGTPAVSPDRNITRQELATLFVRFANYRHVKMNEGGSLDSFEDKAKVASWATDAMKWATAAGLINGTGNGKTLSPEGDATREQFATIIQRYCEAKFDYEIFYAEPKPLHGYTEPEYPLVDGADFYVAVDGDDKNPGTLEAPFATFEKARDAVRELKKTKKGEIKVAFKAGNYGTLDNVTFTAEDGGTADAPITYCKYGDGPVVFTNGIKIEESAFKPVTESDYYLLGSVDTSKVYKTDLKGIIDKLEDNNILFSETAPCYEARIPNKSTLGVDKFYTDVTTTYNEKESILLQSYLPGIVEKFRTVEGMKVSGLLRYGWLLDTFLVKSYNPDTDILTFDFENTTIHNGYDIEDGHVLAYEDRFDDTVYFHNLSDQIDFEGEYWFDPNTKVLYVYEPKGDYHISTGGTFMYIAPGAEYLQFIGLDFSTSTGNGIEIAADHLTFDRCSVSNIAGDGAVVTVFRDGNEGGTRFTTIKNSEFYNFVNMGLDIEASYENYKMLKPSENVIENNYFHDFGSPQFMSKAIMLHWNVGTKIANNEFKAGTESAIVWEYCCDMAIEYNVFEDLMRSSTDRGVLYCFGQITNRSNAIRYNLFKNTRNATQVHSIYFDGSWGQDVYNNLFYNSASCNILFNEGRDNTATSNVMIGNVTPFIAHWGFSDCQNGGNYDDSLAFRYVKAIPARGTVQGDLWYSRWPVMYEYSFDPADLGKYECIFTPVNHVKKNALIGSKLTDKVLLQYGDLDGNAEYKLTDDVGFVCPALGDYRVKDGASVDSVQFEKIGRY